MKIPKSISSRSHRLHLNCEEAIREDPDTLMTELDWALNGLWGQDPAWFLVNLCHARDIRLRGFLRRKK